MASKKSKTSEGCSSEKVEKKTNQSIPTKLIDPMMILYKDAVLAGTEKRDWLTVIEKYLVEKGCTVHKRTIERTIERHMNGIYEPPSARRPTLKIDTTREDEIIYLRSKIDDIAEDLTELFNREKLKDNNTKAVVELADAILRQRDAQLRILSLSGPKKNGLTMVDAQKGRIVMVSGNAEEIQSYSSVNMSARNFSSENDDEDVIDG